MAMASHVSSSSPSVRPSARMHLIDVHLPTADGRELLLTRYTQPEPELQLLIQQRRLQLPPQPPPKITTAALAHTT
jgi:hypothetical protein